jgi:hypothetical protein
MTILSWSFALAAGLIQIFNIIWVLRPQRSSQIYVLPIILWYVALVTRSEGFFFQSPGLEILFIAIVHIALSIIMHIIGKTIERDN